MAIAAEVFARVVANYTRKVHPKYGQVVEARHWMSLYKSALSNEFHTYAVEARMYAEAQRQWGEEELLRGGDSDLNEGLIRAALAGASEELKQVMTVVAGAPRELLAALLEEADDSAWSRRLCRLCRCAVNENIIAELRVLLSP